MLIFISLFVLVIAYSFWFASQPAFGAKATGDSLSGIEATFKNGDLMLPNNRKRLVRKYKYAFGIPLITTPASYFSGRSLQRNYSL